MHDFLQTFMYACIINPGSVTYQGHSKVFTMSGQIKVNPQHYVIKCVVADKFYNAHMAFCLLLCAILSHQTYISLQYSVYYLIFAQQQLYFVQHKIFCVHGQQIIFHLIMMLFLSTACIIIQQAEQVQKLPQYFCFITCFL